MKIVFILEGSDLSGGAKVVLDQAQELSKRGHNVIIVSKEDKMAWHPLEGLKFIRSSDLKDLPEADVGIVTFWTTVLPAFESGKFKKLFHFCQGYEGSFPPYEKIRKEIEKSYALPIPKLLIAPYLKKILEEKFNSKTYLLGQFVDRKNFYPLKEKEFKEPYIFSVVGPYEVELKGVKDALKALQIIKKKFDIKVFRASTFFLTKEEELLGVVDNFFHHLLPEEMGNFYRACHFHIQASHKVEGFPLPPLEAYACKTYPFISDIPSFVNLPFVRFKENDLDDIVQKIELVLKEKNFEKLFENYDDIMEEYSLKKVVDRFENILEQEFKNF